MIRLNQPTNLLRRASRVAIVLFSGWALAACTPETILVDYLHKSPSARHFEATWFLMQEEGRFELLQDLSPELALFVMTRTQREWAEIFQNENFETYAIAAYLRLYPHLSYEEFRDKLPELADVSREAFNYYKGFGEIADADWVKAYLERLELLEARLGENFLEHYYYIDWFDVGKLLRDDDRLLAVLTDNDAAADWIKDYWKKDDYPRYQAFGPIFTGVTPGTGS